MAPNNTEVNQVNILIEQKEEEIKGLEQLRSDFENEEAPEPRPAAEVAQDESASREERAAAAVATTGQEPAAVFAQQSAPSPSTHDEAPADEQGDEEVEEQPEEESAEEADAANQGVTTRDGRGDVNALGDPETIGEGADVVQEAAEEDADADGDGDSEDAESEEKDNSDKS